MSDYTFNSIAIVRINPHRLRNIILISLSVIFIVCLLSSLSANKGIKVVHDSQSPEVFPFGKNTLPSFNSVSFFSSDESVLLKGWFFQVNGSKKVVIFVHDYSKNRLVFNEKTDTAIIACLDRGYNVLLFDLRNSGNVASSKTTLGINETNDVQGAVLYAKALDMRQIYIIGFGTGANAILNAEKSPEIRAVVLDSPYFRLKNPLKYIYLENNVGTLFFTKSFTKLFLRLFDKAKQKKYDEGYYDDMPPVLLTRSGFSYMNTGEEKKLYDNILLHSKNPTILAAISSEPDATEYLNMIFNFFDEYADVENNGG